ncbi:YbjN domain-containing protein [Nostoc sp. FACHB-973]|uniref:YbjN domain-containing protein n=1 Tax=Desmonostoc muscorum LEGE 12446 TaxID=1828758 RepID=A0A8J7D934_DESMC|nr:YbjN domain-containing protein [Desmonostoc muscorum]MBD2515422.1 YbjN domain-containing protein [Nostoc sp. FACHB-973]MBX9253769.1 YbjN domain-containing protein [Desmonostoc muscorum CCALA 125]MCF2145016.1 YbjN domain-containing protein [Desmonostoc muscorum LEGE 12446]
MTSYQETLTSDEAINELIAETTGINHVEVIENVIDSLEQDDSAMVSHTPEGSYLWKFKYGSVEVFVQLSGKSDEDTITVWSAVLDLPAKNEPKLMRYLLELNCSSTFEARFGIIENRVVVISTRTLAELSPGEVSRLITIVATIADNNDDALQSEFGAA